jgi:hypothetical protein
LSMLALVIIFIYHHFVMLGSKNRWTSFLKVAFLVHKHCYVFICTCHHYVIVCAFHHSCVVLCLRRRQPTIFDFVAFLVYAITPLLCWVWKEKLGFCFVFCYIIVPTIIILFLYLRP